MVESFSISEAMVTPLRVIRRHPLAVFAWGFAVAAFYLICMTVIFGALADIPLGPDAEASPALMGRVLAMQGASMLLNVGQLALTLMVWAATMRATLRIGRPDRFLFMRVGMDELRLLVVGAALFLGTYLAVIILVVLGAAVSAVIWQASEAAAVITGGVMLLLLIVGVAVAMARLSMIAPATMILQRLAFVEGWKLGRGRTLRLLGLLACTWLVYLFVYFIVAFTVIVVLFASGYLAHFHGFENAATLGDLFPSAPVLWAVAGLALIPGAFLYGAVMTLLSAPFVAACRELLDGAPGDAPATIG